MIITIDGPSGTGKSTTARALAKILSFHYINTGTMYRALAYTCLQSPWSSLPLEEVLAHPPFSFTPGETLQVFLQGKLLIEELRTQEVANKASLLSQIPAVRQHMQLLQRQYSKMGNCVFEGRDMGSTVFPHADLKLFLTASPEIRAQRRLKDLNSSSMTPTELLHELVKRDEADQQRSCDPLVIPDSAIVIDSSSLTLDQVLEKILPLVPLDRL